MLANTVIFLKNFSFIVSCSFFCIIGALLFFQPRTEFELEKTDKKKYREAKEKLKKQKKEKLKEKLREERKHSHRHIKLKTASKCEADTSSDPARKIKDNFRLNMAGVIVHYLNPYRKPDCKIGRITNTEDFKHLARKVCVIRCF